MGIFFFFKDNLLSRCSQQKKLSESDIKALSCWPPCWFQSRIFMVSVFSPELPSLAMHGYVHYISLDVIGLLLSAMVRYLFPERNHRYPSILWTWTKKVPGQSPSLSLEFGSIISHSLLALALDQSMLLPIPSLRHEDLSLFTLFPPKILSKSDSYYYWPSSCF